MLNSRYVLFEAQQAFFYGLQENLALASVTSTPATVLGLDHRIGFIKAGTRVNGRSLNSHLIITMAGYDAGEQSSMSNRQIDTMEYRRCGLGFSPPCPWCNAKASLH